MALTLQEEFNTLVSKLVNIDSQLRTNQKFIDSYKNSVPGDCDYPIVEEHLKNHIQLATELSIYRSELACLMVDHASEVRFLDFVPLEDNYDLPFD